MFCAVSSVSLASTSRNAPDARKPRLPSNDGLIPCVMSSARFSVTCHRLFPVPTNVGSNNTSTTGASAVVNVLSAMWSSAIRRTELTGSKRASGFCANTLGMRPLDVTTVKYLPSGSSTGPIKGSFGPTLPRVKSVKSLPANGPDRSSAILESPPASTNSPLASKTHRLEFKRTNASA